MQAFTKRDFDLLCFLVRVDQTVDTLDPTIHPIKPERDNRHVSRSHRAYKRPQAKRVALAYIQE
jgi:hypothetical protein